MAQIRHNVHARLAKIIVLDAGNCKAVHHRRLRHAEDSVDGVARSDTLGAVRLAGLVRFWQCARGIVNLYDIGRASAGNAGCAH